MGESCAKKKAIILAVMTLFASSVQAEHFEVSEPAEDGDSTLVLGEVKVLAKKNLGPLLTRRRIELSGTCLGAGQN